MNSFESMNHDFQCCHCLIPILMKNFFDFEKELKVNRQKNIEYV